MDWKHSDEQAHLCRVLRALMLWIEQATDLADDQRRNLLSLQAWMFEQLRGHDDVEGVQDASIAQQQMVHIAAQLGHNARVDRQLQRMAKQPYFARLFFAEGTGETETIAIGHGAVIEAKTRDFLVNDWRAPIASLYYDCEPGEVTYRAPAGDIRVNLMRKQYIRIEDGELLGIHDSSVAMIDDMLLDVLGRSASMHMRDVVATIQRDQYAAIRDEDCDMMVVAGPAGSGKTTVALHRVAYLLYRRRATLKAGDVRVVSPTAAFSEAISRVLPDLGEDGVPVLTYSDMAQSRLMLPVEGILPAFERALNSEKPDPRRSAEFVREIEDFAKELEQTPPNFADIAYGKAMAISAEELRRLYFEDMTSVAPALRLYRIRVRVTSKLASMEKRLYGKLKDALKPRIEPRLLDTMARLEAAERMNPLWDALYRMTTLDVPALYEKWLEKRELSARGLCEKRAVCGEDAGALLYLCLRMGVARPEYTVKHVVVDEAQDISPIQMAALRMVYPNAGITFLGDPRQTVWPGQAADLEQLIGYAAPKNLHQAWLLRSYRNAQPIGEYCGKLDDSGEDAQYFGRPGEPVEEIRGGSQKDATRAFVAALGGRNKTSVLITRDLAQAERLYESLSGDVKATVTLLREETLLPDEGLIIAPVMLAKGLEFDAVTVYWPGEAQSPQARRLLYTACSRALHTLTVVY